MKVVGKYIAREFIHSYWLTTLKLYVKKEGWKKIYHKKSNFVEECMGKNLILKYKSILIDFTGRHLMPDLFSYTASEIL